GRHRDADEKGVAAGRGQRLERLAVERRRMRRVGRVDQRRLPGDRDVFFEAAELERDVERDELLRADRQPFRFIRLVAGELGLERVGGWRDGWEAVLTDVVGCDLTRDIGGFVGQRDGDARDYTVGVAHQAANATGELLRRGAGRCGNQKQYRQDCIADTS